MHTIAAKAVCFKEALDPSFKTYAEQVVKNASVLADTLMAEGFKLVSGGTDNHLMLVNLTDTGVTGKEAEKMLDEVGITVNKTQFRLIQRVRSLQAVSESVLLPQLQEVLKKKIWSKSVNLSL